MPAAEFDRYADDYHRMLGRSTGLFGDPPAFFHRYKIADTRRTVDRSGVAVRNILDFGCGIGSSIPYFRELFPAAGLVCADTSSRSLEIAAQRFPGASAQLAVQPAAPLALADGRFDLCFSACVFHHIDHAEHVAWLRELRRVTRPGGALVIFEHNPLNPLTRHVVHTCPLDVNARLVRAGTLARAVRTAGWRHVRVGYRLFFPGFLAALRPLEPLLAGLPLGAQYRLHAVNAEDG